MGRRGAAGHADRAAGALPAATPGRDGQRRGGADGQRGAGEDDRGDRGRGRRRTWQILRPLRDRRVGAPRAAFIPYRPVPNRRRDRQERHYPFAWNEAGYRGRLYALPFQTGIRGLYANVAHLREAGLRPDQPPRTMTELDQLAVRLSQQSGDGFSRLGFRPWAGNSHFYTWGWLFGGEFFDDRANRCTANHPKNVEAMTRGLAVPSPPPNTPQPDVPGRLRPGARPAGFGRAGLLPARHPGPDGRPGADGPPAGVRHAGAAARRRGRRRRLPGPAGSATSCPAG